LGKILKLQTNEEDYNQKKPFHDRITNILFFYWNVILNKVYKTAAIFIKRLKNEHAANFYIIGEFFAKILYLDGIGVQIMIIKHDTQH